MDDGKNKKKNKRKKNKQQQNKGSENVASVVAEPTAPENVAMVLAEPKAPENVATVVAEPIAQENVVAEPIAPENVVGVVGEPISPGNVQAIVAEPAASGNVEAIVAEPSAPENVLGVVAKPIVMGKVAADVAEPTAPGNIVAVVAEPAAPGNVAKIVAEPNAPGNVAADLAESTAPGNVVVEQSAPDVVSVVMVEPTGQNGENSRAALLDASIAKTEKTHDGKDANQLAEAVKADSLDRGAMFEEKIKVFQNEKELQREIQTTLEEKIQYLQNERMEDMQKVAKLEAEVREIKKEKKSLMQKGNEFEMRIMQLEGDKQSWLRRENELEITITQLQSEKQLWLSKEVGFEEKIKQLMDVVATPVLKEAHLKEEVKQMEEDRAALAHEQVLGLEATRNSLLEENNLLKGNISSMQLRIENLEKAAESHIASTGKQLHTSENGDISIEEDAVHKLVEKLSKEKAELVEKVNELNVMLAKRGITEDKSSIINMQSDSQNAASGHIATVSPSLEQIPSAINMHASGEIQPVETVAITTGNAGDNLGANFRTVHPYLPKITRSDEIEQIPLSQNENHYMSSDDNLNPDSRIPLTDAPLIGAPFRLISFFARYVSGADLVNKNDPS